MKNQQRFAEIELCLDKYFQANLAPVMQRIQIDLNDKQAKEFDNYKSSFTGILSGMADESHMVPGIDSSFSQLNVTGKWNNKKVEDYLAMCQKDIAGNKTIQKDLEKLSAEWRKAVIAEIGRTRYDQLSKQLGSDLAYAYIDYRVQQLMVNHMVDRETPRSTADYIMKKAASDSLIGLGGTMQRSPVANEISVKAEKAYNPSLGEQATARVASFGIDVASTGCVSSWASIGRFAATEVVFDGIGMLAEKKRANEKTMTVEECISQAVFSSSKNVFPELRRKSKSIKTWDNEYIKGVNDSLTRKMGITTTRPMIIDMMEKSKSQFQSLTSPFKNPSMNPSEESKRREELRKQYNIPSVILPGHEEEYIKTLEGSRAKAQKPASDLSQAQIASNDTVATATEQTPEQTNPQSQLAEATEVQNPSQDNSSGWDRLLGTLGFNGFGDIGHNLGYVISMLPDILVGMWTGKTKSLDLKDNLVPYASVLAGMFVRNPILKMLLIGMGGANLLNKAGHEALANADGENRLQARPQYLRYADQPLNPRISDVTISGTTLIATIDKVPCTVRLTEDIVNAYHSGALPLNTLANTILERNEQRQVVMDNNYERLQEQQRQQQVVLK